MSKHPETAQALAREIVAASPASGTLSAPTAAGKAAGVDRLRIRKAIIAGKTSYQLERLCGPKAFHENLDAAGFERALEESIGTLFSRAEFSAEALSISVLANRRGELSAIRHRAQAETIPETATEGHDRAKRYILPEGTPVPFLIDLGVMTADGAIVKSRYDKFRQINRFLEFIEDALPALREAAGQNPDGSGGRELTVVDFGCGKSYLTFATYYYLSVLKGIPVRIIGLDLKRDVIESCAELAASYGYDRLEFSVGDIAGYRGLERADMVVTLHACDTATDAALAQAVRWGARVILSVPCCQHELNGILGDGAHVSPAKETLKGAFRYGIVRERLAALFTDAMRAELLSGAGYRVQILEFIDMSHTPKNLLIRAILPRERVTASGDAQTGTIETGIAEYRALREFLGAAPALEAALKRDREEH
jgi:SAM-dependent methyltransferase